MNDAPANGDFASYLNQLGTARPPAAAPVAAALEVPGASEDAVQVPAPVLAGAQPVFEDLTALEILEGPSAETLEHTAALMTPSNLSDEELERQALAHPGADGDASTPE
jgi:hypothetical protein